MNLIQNDTCLTAMLSGEIDHHTAKEAREQIDAAVHHGHTQVLRLDFGGVTFMDSSGVGLIMGRYRLMQGLGGRVEVIHASPRMEQLMRMAGLGVLNVICSNTEKRKDDVK